MHLLLTVLTAAWLSISPGSHYIQTEDGDQFFWMGNTAWLMPQKMTREDVDMFMTSCRDNGYNVVQVYACNDVPSVNAYGQRSGSQEYWYLLDYIVSKAYESGIYVAISCLPSRPVRLGKLDSELAEAYGKFLATRYADKPNVIWLIGCDARGDQNVQIWETIATAIKSVDKRHLMTFHPMERRSSLQWWNDSSWLDFNMFSSGHRRYDQEFGDADDEFADRAEDNWRYVKAAWNAETVRPVLDGQPSYEDVPQGLRDVSQSTWHAEDCRRYAYWSVFEGACGHTYGHNSMMQCYSGEGPGLYQVSMSWKEALSAPGFTQMRHLRALMDVFSCKDRVPAHDVVTGNGERYERIAATKGPDFILAYTYTNSPIRLDLSAISGTRKQAWWMNPATGELEFVGETKNSVETYRHPGSVGPGNDYVLIVLDWKSSRKMAPLKSSQQHKFSTVFKKGN